MYYCPPHKVKLERFGTMRLQAKCGPGSTEGDMREATVGCHRTNGPVRGIFLIPRYSEREVYLHVHSSDMPKSTVKSLTQARR